MDDVKYEVGHPDWAGVTVLDPLGLALVLLCGIGLLCLPRRYAVWPMIVVACFVAPAQRIIILSLNFNFLRIMVVFGWVRLILRGELSTLRLLTLDIVLIGWAVSTTVAFTLLNSSFAAFINRLGASYDAVGMYFLFRCLIRDWDDADTAVLGFILISVPVAIFFVVEHFTGRNAFAFLGGVPAITMVREGRLRCQGAFAHPILAGCFWASVMPLFAARWWKAGASHPLAVVGLVGCGVIILTCASSTPIMAVAFGLLGAVMFYARHRMRLILVGVAITLAGLHMVMKAPVWHLISRLDIVSGNTGWHRYHLIDQAINHVDDWWLIGARSIDHWNIFANDVTNQYILEGVTGGLMTLGLFVAVIMLAFAIVGRLWRTVQRDPYKLAFAWALGVSLFIHCTNFVAVSYFGQINFLWYMVLAITAGLDPGCRPACASTRKQPSPPCLGHDPAKAPQSCAVNNH